MKRIFSHIFSVGLLMGITLWSGCSNDAVIEEIQPPIETEFENENTYVATLIAGLPGNNTESRLAYELTNNGKSIKTLWESGDQLVVKLAGPSSGYTDIFTIKDGIGTSSGTFECENMNKVSTNMWAMFFPSTITCEKDFLEFTYTGQKQTKNDNLDHLKKYHTLRYLYWYEGEGDNALFDQTYIDLSGEDVEESACMKFNLSNLESSTPSNIELIYMNSEGAYTDLFFTHNCLSSWYGSTSPNWERTYKMSLALEGFSATTSITAYMMLSNYDISVEAGGKFRVIVTTDKGKFYCDKTIASDVTLQGGKLHSITCTEWTKVGDIDGFDSPQSGVVVLQEAELGNPGADIIIMGDGFAEDQFSDGTYEAYMKNAYEDFFSVEPYASLKEYFNVYYINAVSQENHDAEPYYDESKNQNGATMGDAVTIFNTQFTPGSTSISGNNDMVLQYAKQAIRTKGGKGGTAVTDETEVSVRANTALMMVMVNVPCYAGTCSIAWTNDTEKDYGTVYSIGYTSLGNDGSGVQCKWTTLHECGGHGFGKLADEYGGGTITEFSTGNWTNLANYHTYGIFRNVNEYWGQEEINDGWKIDWTTTTSENVYWSDLLTYSSYIQSIEENGEGLGIYRGAYTYENLFCRPTENSIMRNQMATNGQFFNAISRWAIWYRVMRLTNSTTATQFKKSLAEFIAFDENLKIEKNQNLSSRSLVEPIQEFKPLGPPVLIKGHWENGNFVKD